MLTKVHEQIFENYHFRSAFLAMKLHVEASKKPIRAVIPARENSTRIPNKNFAHVGGATLFDLSIEFARNIFPENHFFCFTDRESSYTIKRNGFGDKEGDESSMKVLLQEFFRVLGESGIDPGGEWVLLQPTSPFRNPWLLLDMLCSQRLPNQILCSVDSDLKPDGQFWLFDHSMPPGKENRQAWRGIDSPYLSPFQSMQIDWPVEMDELELILDSRLDSWYDK